MQRSLFAAFIAVAAVVCLSHCGKSLSDEEKKTAAVAMSSLGSSGQSKTFQRQERAAEDYVREQTRTGNNCVPAAAVHTGLYTFTVTCPTTTKWQVTMVEDAGADDTRQCTGTTVHVGSTNATFTFEVSGNNVAFSIDLKAKVGNSSPSDDLDCKYAATIDITSSSSTGSVTVDHCTYKGADLTSESLGLANCSTR